MFDSYPGQLEQVIINLVNNAVLHGRNGDAALTVKIVAALVTDENSVRLSFSDNGRGMSAEVVAQAFEPFFTTRLGSGGTGLGLHLVRKLVHDTLGGHLDMTSAPGQGTCFDITLPRVAPVVS